MWRGVVAREEVGAILRTQSESREVAKKQSEVDWCLLVAHEINQLEAAEYYVPTALWQLANCKREPTDVIFQSASGKLPSRMAQVVTIPHVTSNPDLELRDDNGNVRKLEASVRRVLLPTGNGRVGRSTFITRGRVSFKA